MLMSSNANCLCFEQQVSLPLENGKKTRFLEKKRYEESTWKNEIAIVCT